MIAYTAQVKARKRGSDCTTDPDYTRDIGVCTVTTVNAHQAVCLLLSDVRTECYLWTIYSIAFVHDSCTMLTY
jgi:hypothetical protein